MRLLFLSNFYPPYDIGGYEQWCAEVATELSQRGHQVIVLTSRPPEDARESHRDGVHVLRELHLEVESGLLHSLRRTLLDRRRLERENLERVQRILDRFRPNAALIWGMWNVPRSVPALVERLLPGRVAYYLCDYWPSLPSVFVQQWQSPANRSFAEPIKQLLGRWIVPRLAQQTTPRLLLEHPICVSQSVRDRLVEAGVPVEHGLVVYGGIDVEEIHVQTRERDDVAGAQGIKLVYLGRLTPEKGLETAIRALALLEGPAYRPLTLQVVGRGSPTYEAHLRALVRCCGLEDRVVFRGGVPRSEIPSILAECDVLVFTSTWQEPFARVILEAMAAGLLVVGSTAGGAAEIEVEGVNCLTFPPGDARAQADQLRRALHDPELRRRLVAAARRTVEERFTIRQMVDRLEACLLSVADRRGLVAAGPRSPIPTPGPLDAGTWRGARTSLRGDVVS